MDFLMIVVATYALQAVGAWMLIDARQPVFRKTVATLWICAAVTFLMLGLSFGSLLIQLVLAGLAGLGTMVAKAQAEAWRSRKASGGEGGRRSGHDRA